MNWNKITLGQFQAINKLTEDAALDEFDKVAQLIAIVYGLTSDQVDELSLQQFNEMGKACQFLLSDAIPGKPVKTFRVGKKKYAINYRVTNLTHRQHMEIIGCLESPIENMHKVIASIVMPVRFGMRKQNKASDYNAVVEDMLNAPFVAVYHSWIFFCKLFKNTMIEIKDFLIKEMISNGMTEDYAKMVMAKSIEALDLKLTN